MTTWTDVTKSLQQYYHFSVKYKNESLLMKFLGKLMWFNPEFMSMYTTTIGSTTYLPSKELANASAQDTAGILCHELMHVMDDRKYGIVFKLGYLFPQILAVLSLLAIPLWSWWPLAFLLFLAPLPAPWRMWFELRGYTMTMAFQYWSTGQKIDDTFVEWVVTMFTGPTYWYMWPFPNHIRGLLRKQLTRINNGEVIISDSSSATYTRVKLLISLLNRNGKK